MCKYPYILHCRYLVLAKHFEIPLLKRPLDPTCFIAHFCKWQKYEVLLWQTEHFEIPDLLKIVVCLAGKSILALESAGQIPAGTLLATGCEQSGSAWPAKASPRGWDWPQVPCSPELWAAPLRKVLLSLKTGIKLIQNQAFRMRPTALGQLSSFSRRRDVHRVGEAVVEGESLAWGAELQWEGLSTRVSAVPPPPSVFCLLTLSHIGVLKSSRSSEGELLSLLVAGSHRRAVGSYQLLSDPSNVFTTWNNFKIRFPL